MMMVLLDVANIVTFSAVNLKIKSLELNAN